jgi:hypothetical protein
LNAWVEVYLWLIDNNIDSSGKGYNWCPGKGRSYYRVRLDHTLLFDSIFTLRRRAKMHHPASFSYNNVIYY